MDDRKLLQDALHDAAKEWSKPDPEEMETLLRNIRKVLARYRVIQLDALIKQIDALLGK